MLLALGIVVTQLRLSSSADLPPYPDYHYSHVILDLINTPFKEREGMFRLDDNGWPYAFGREWINEGPYVDIIKVEGRVQNPPGKYYLYFTIHAHIGTGMAYADNLDGPWTTLDTLLWEDGAATDVHWLEGKRKFGAYYHPSNSYSAMRFSDDGIHWSESQQLATAGDLYGGGAFFYTKVFTHTCPSLDNTYIMLWRAQSPDTYQNGRWEQATCLMYSDNGVDWTFHPEPVHNDGFPMGTNFMKWGDVYLMFNWGHRSCSKLYQVGGPNILIWETDADLAEQTGSASWANSWPVGECENTMKLIEAEPGCGYTIDADSGRGPYEGQHIIEEDTLYHFGPAWNDSMPNNGAVNEEGQPTTHAYNGKKWACGQIGLWKAPVPGGVVKTQGRVLQAVPLSQAKPGSATCIVLRDDMLHSVTIPGNRTVPVYTARGQLLGTIHMHRNQRTLSAVNSSLGGKGIRILDMRNGRKQQ